MCNNQEATSDTRGHRIEGFSGERGTWAQHHRRHPPPLRFQALEHRQHLAVVERVQRRQLQYINHAGQLGQRSPHRVDRDSHPASGSVPFAPSAAYITDTTQRPPSARPAQYLVQLAT